MTDLDVNNLPKSVEKTTCMVVRCCPYPFIRNMTIIFLATAKGKRTSTTHLKLHNSLRKEQKNIIVNKVQCIVSRNRKKKSRKIINMLFRHYSSNFRLNPSVQVESYHGGKKFILPKYIHNSEYKGGIFKVPSNPSLSVIL